MGRAHRLWTILLAMLVLASQASAQGPYTAQQLAALRGSKVRLSTYGGTLKGIVQGVSEEGLRLRRSSWQTDELPVEGIQQVEVYSRDRGGTITGMTLGGGLGLGLGLGVASWLDALDDQGGIGDSGKVLMGSLGALLGATIVAYLMGSVWTPLPAHPRQASDAPDGSPVAIAFEWRF